MKKLSDDEKRPFFGGGVLISSEGIIKTKTVLEFNSQQGIQDKRSQQITVDSLTMHEQPVQEQVEESDEGREYATDSEEEEENQEEIEDENDQGGQDGAEGGDEQRMDSAQKE